MPKKHKLISLVFFGSAASIATFVGTKLYFKQLQPKVRSLVDRDREDGGIKLSKRRKKGINILLLFF